MLESSKHRPLQERLEAFTGNFAEQIKREFAREISAIQRHSKNLFCGWCADSFRQDGVGRTILE
jgi:hypothetical protein